MIFIVRVCDWERANPGTCDTSIVAGATVERAIHISRVDVPVGVQSRDKRGELVLGNLNIFVLTLIDRALDPVSLVIVHGITDGEPTHEVANTWFWAPEILAQDEVKVVGEEEKGVEGDGRGA